MSRAPQQKKCKRCGMKKRMPKFSVKPESKGTRLEICKECEGKGFLTEKQIDAALLLPMQIRWAEEENNAALV